MQLTTQPSIDPLARAAFARELAPRRWRASPLVPVLALASSLALALAAGILLLAVVGAWAGGYRYRPLADAPAWRVPAAAAAVAADGRGLDQLDRERRRLAAALERKAPRQSYLVVDRTNNLLYLRTASEIERQAVCSAGSGSILKDPTGKRTWVFDTPQGAFRVRSILERPAWRKPDWAFIEEGEPIPKNPGERIEYGVLGEYGLDFGDGYLIHGTLYERLLGRNVTHGCIRLGKKDLRAVVRAAHPGTRIYIF